MQATGNTRGTAHQRSGRGSRMVGVVAGSLLCAALPVLAHARGTDTAVTIQPSFDVWMYNQGSGALSTFAPTFGSELTGQDPDRLGYYLVAFDTRAQVDPAAGPWEVVSARLTIYMINSSNFSPADGVRYDPTPDVVASYGPGATITDADPGRPFELFASGLADGLTYDAWRNAGAPVSFGGVNASLPIDFDAAGQPRDVTNNVQDGFDTAPLALGLAETTYVGSDGSARIADTSAMFFDLDIARPDVAAYLADGLADGWVALNVSSLHDVGVFGSGGEVYARWATMETFGFPDPALELTVRPARPACAPDLTTNNTNPGDQGFGQPDGLVNGADLSYFVELWLGGQPAADLTSNNTNPGDPGFGQPDGLINGADLSFYVEQWLGGCP